MALNFKVSHQQAENERISLKDALPLDTPLSLQIELASACNFKCRFCMRGNTQLLQSGVYRAGIMKWKLFQKIVDDCRSFPGRIKFVSLQCRGESLLNPRLPDMIRYLKDAGVAGEVVLNTNASLLTEELSLAIADAGLDHLRISIEAVSREGYREISGVDLDFDQLVRQIEYFYLHRGRCQVYTKILDCGMKDEEKEKFIRVFGGISDNIFIERPVDLWKGAGLEENLFSVNRWNQDVYPTEICPRIFFAYAVHFDGVVVGCDSDWKEEQPVGDARTGNMAEIWNGEELRRMRYNHLTKNTLGYERCKGCFVYKECLSKDRLDDSAAELARKYKGDSHV